MIRIFFASLLLIALVIAIPAIHRWLKRPLAAVEFPHERPAPGTSPFYNRRRQTVNKPRHIKQRSGWRNT